MSNNVGNYLSNPTIIIVAAVIILFAFVVVLVWDRKAREVLPIVKHFCMMTTGMIPSLFPGLLVFSACYTSV